MISNGELKNAHVLYVYFHLLCLQMIKMHTKYSNTNSNNNYLSMESTILEIQGESVYLRCNLKFCHKKQNLVLINSYSFES